jgi:hypothetical protein
MIIPLLVGLLFFAIGIFILIYGIVALIKRRNLNANSLSTTGVVMAFATQMGRSGYLYFPEVEFQLAAGQTVRFQSSVGSSAPRYDVGHQVKVLYSAHNPQEAEIDTLTSMWLLPGCMVGMGLLFTIIGLLLSVIMTLMMINQP